MIDYIVPSEIGNHVLLADKLNEMIDEINKSIYVLSIPLDTIKPLFEAKDAEITAKTTLLDEKIKVVKDQEKEIEKLRGPIV